MANVHYICVQVNVAYKNKVTELTNKGLEEEELSKELELLKVDVA